MKFLIALFFGVMLNGYAVSEFNGDKTAPFTPAETKVEEDYCQLTLSGYASFEGFRIPITLSAEAETCEEAAEEMRQNIIEREIRIAY